MKSKSFLKFILEQTARKAKEKREKTSTANLIQFFQKKLLTKETSCDKILRQFEF